MKLLALGIGCEFSTATIALWISACTLNQQDPSKQDTSSQAGNTGHAGAVDRVIGVAGATSAIAGNATTGAASGFSGAGAGGGPSAWAGQLSGEPQAGISPSAGSTSNWHSGQSSAGSGLGGAVSGVATAGRSPSGGSTVNQVGTPASGTMVPELVGVWQQTRASSGDYVSSSGATFSLTSGFSVQLKLSSNGAYYLANFGSGVAQTCGSVSQFEQSVGTAELVGNSLVFRPTEHIIDVSDCTGSRRLDLGTAPFQLSISLEEATHFYGGIRTYRMQATGGPHPYDLMLVHRPALVSPVAPAQPADFTLGTYGPFDDFQGLWVAAAGTDSNFFNPLTGEYYFPVLNGSPHAWLRMGPDGYDTAIALQNVNSDGPCKSDVIYYEQGDARFAVLDDIGGAGNHFVGHARFQSAAARLIVRIRECDESNGVYTYDLPSQPRYFRFIYFSPAAPPESITLGCDFPLSEWQSILCEAFPKGFTRR